MQFKCVRSYQITNVAKPIPLTRLWVWHQVDMCMALLLVYRASPSFAAAIMPIDYAAAFLIPDLPLLKAWGGFVHKSWGTMDCKRWLSSLVFLLPPLPSQVWPPVFTMCQLTTDTHLPPPPPPISLFSFILSPWISLQKSLNDWLCSAGCCCHIRC